MFYCFKPPTPLAIYTLSLHDALPISDLTHVAARATLGAGSLANVREHLEGWIADAQAFKPGSEMPPTPLPAASRDRKSTRLNSSHVSISYAVFCLKKKITYTLDKYSS